MSIVLYWALLKTSLDWCSLPFKFINKFIKFSFSSNLYPHLSSKEQVRSHVRTDNKMAKPKDCLEEIYQIMRSCFEYDAANRPSFRHLHQQLQNIQAKN